MKLLSTILLYITLSSITFLYGSNNSAITAKFMILNNFDSSNTQYEAKLLLSNNGPAINYGWSVNIKFSSPDQTIVKVISGGIQSKNSTDANISNLPQNPFIAQGSTRQIRMIIKKANSTIPTNPIMTISITPQPSSSNIKLNLQAIG